MREEGGRREGGERRERGGREEGGRREEGERREGGGREEGGEVYRGVIKAKFTASIEWSLSFTSP